MLEPLTQRRGRYGAWRISLPSHKKINHKGVEFAGEESLKGLHSMDEVEM